MWQSLGVPLLTDSGDDPAFVCRSAYYHRTKTVSPLALNHADAASWPWHQVWAVVAQAVQHTRFACRELLEWNRTLRTSASMPSLPDSYMLAIESWTAISSPSCIARSLHLIVCQYLTDAMTICSSDLRKQISAQLRATLNVMSQLDSYHSLMDESDDVFTARSSDSDGSSDSESADDEVDSKQQQSQQQRKHRTKRRRLWNDTDSEDETLSHDSHRHELLRSLSSQGREQWNAMCDEEMAPTSSIAAVSSSASLSSSTTDANMRPIHDLDDLMKEVAVALTAASSGGGAGVGGATASGSLSLSGVPQVMPCRENERRLIHQYVQAAISNGRADGSLYLGGLPGTGKTATVLSTMMHLKSLQSNGQLPPFDFIELNALRLSSAQRLFVALYRQLADLDTAERARLLAQLQSLEYSTKSSRRNSSSNSDPSDDASNVAALRSSLRTAATSLLEQMSRISVSRAVRLLSQRFATPSSRRKFLVLLVDEMDALMTKQQQVLYQLFEWCRLPHSRLAVIGISNTIDLPAAFHQKVLSRLGLQRIDFLSYTADQLKTILRHRLVESGFHLVSSKAQNIESDQPIFYEETIDLCAKRISAVNGDFRRALDACRRAADHAHGQPVTLQLMARALHETEGAMHTNVVRNRTSCERILLFALYLALKADGEESTPFVSITERFNRLWGMVDAQLLGPHIAKPNEESLLRMCRKYYSLAMIEMNWPVTAAWPTLRLALPIESIEASMMDDPIWNRLKNVA